MNYHHRILIIVISFIHSNAVTQVS